MDKEARKELLNGIHKLAQTDTELAQAMGTRTARGEYPEAVAGLIAQGVNLLGSQRDGIDADIRGTTVIITYNGQRYTATVK